MTASSHCRHSVLLLLLLQLSAKYCRSEFLVSVTVANRRRWTMLLAALRLAESYSHFKASVEGAFVWLGLPSAVTILYTFSYFRTRWTMLFSGLLLACALLSMFGGSVLTIDDWSDTDVELARSLQQNVVCERAVSSQRTSLHIGELSQQPQLHFHLHIQVSLTNSILITVTNEWYAVI